MDTLDFVVFVMFENCFINENINETPTHAT